MSQGSVVAICVAGSKGQKSTVDEACLVEGSGIEGDVHAGSWHRQISLLDAADIESMRGKGLELEPGAFGENLVVEGLALDRLGIGSELEIGAARLEITQIGKVCHSRCKIFYAAGDCIMPRAGVFARVIKGATISPGAPVAEARLVPRETAQAAVITVSDSAAAGAAEDTSGPAVAAQLERELEANIACSLIVPDDEQRLASELVELCDRSLDLIVTTGGTGCAHRDRTPEATRRVIEREVPGLAEAMRLVSSEITPHAWLQRGICGIRGSTLIINLPGSHKGATENLAAVTPVLGHAIRLLRGETAHPEHGRKALVAKGSGLSLYPDEPGSDPVP